MSPALSRLTAIARADPTYRFLTLAHLLTPEALGVAFRQLRKDASAGVDAVTYAEYAEQAEENIRQLHERLKSRRYRAQPLRRIYIPKDDGKERPISIPVLEDKIVQRATVTVLEAIYEPDFRGCSYGFRPGRSAHDALDTVRRTMCFEPVAYVLDADICGYFDAIVRPQLMELVQKRIGDSSLLRLIGKWLHVGVVDEGRLLVTETGVGQGQVISPLLANIYLHYVLDTWFEDEVVPRLRGAAYLIRYADDVLFCFQYREDADRVQRVLTKRLANYGLTLHPDKTRLHEFGRPAWARWRHGRGRRPPTFDFLGFTHVCATSRRGRFTLHLRTMRRRLGRSVRAVALWCQRHRHDPVVDQAAALNRKLRGHYQYYGRATNYRSLWQFYRTVVRLWHKWLNRRTRGKPLRWARYEQLLARHPLVRPRVTRAWHPAGSPA
jgi:RNA-directed DNA polymerase